MTNQQKLEGYFKIVPEFSQFRKVFIYDPNNRRAYFDHLPRQTDRFILSACDIRLYIRKSINKYPEMPILETLDISASLIKSNLQKAVRRKQTSVAIASTIALLKKNTVELLRRLPIIMIEDVCAMDSLPILVWLMMVCSSRGSEYKLTNEDKYVILQIVNNMCLCDYAVVMASSSSDTKDNETIEWTHQMIDASMTTPTSDGIIKKDICLSMFYREKYGGMKCDLRMLNYAIQFYNSNECVQEKEIKRTDWYLDLHLPHVLEIMSEAIDFHPFPSLLKQMSIKTGICETEIKRAIWTSESCVNFRKKYTVVVAEQYKNTNVWILLKHHLAEFRENMAQFDGFILCI